ncbi:MAG: GHMP kinase [Verrucomicrobia bacterium]|nr:GHMP kinase [Verrucomicrobiota bacterium]
MIISRTPFRVSFAGGGTDIPVFYRQKPGAVLSTAINKYMFISVHQPFDQRIRLKYSKTEEVDSVDAVEHPIIREALRLVGIEGGIEIASIADIPAQAGLGSSSSFAVALLHALHAFKGGHVSAEQLAREACEIEMTRLREPIGKQDQYIAAYGGLKFFQFMTDETVLVDPVVCSAETRQQLHRHLMMFHCSGARSARDILNSQNANAPAKMASWERMTGIAYEMKRALTDNGGVAVIGELLHEAWMLKRSMTSKISNPAIDEWYDRARKAGALGGKLLGAGGGGFLLFFVPPQKQEAVKQGLADLRQIPFEFEPEGSKIIYFS